MIENIKVIAFCAIASGVFILGIVLGDKRASEGDLSSKIKEVDKHTEQLYTQLKNQQYEIDILTEKLLK